MKKMIHWLLVLCLLVSLLPGCGSQPGSSSANPGDTAASGGTAGSAPADSKPANSVIGVAENPGSDMAEYDPNRTLYVSVGQFDMDLYPDIPISSFNFQILSLEPLDPETISVSLPLETKYISFVTDVSDRLHRKNLNDEINTTPFPCYLYQIYAGADWEALGKGILGEDYEAYLEQLRIRDALAVDFMSMPLSEIPEFYAYYITVYLEEYKEETWEYVDIIIGDQVIRKDVGSLRIHEEHLFEPDKAKYLSYDQFYGYVDWAWSDGDGQWAYIQFTAEEDMTLNSFMLPTTASFADTGVCVSVTSEAGSYSFSWDGKEPVQIYKGETVRVDASFWDKQMRKLHAYAQYYVIVEYETEDGVFYTVGSRFVAKDLNFHELYAIAFNGVDVEPYYRYYYYPVLQRREVRD